MDYPIPANLNSLRFQHTLAHLLVRAVREGADLRNELKRYRTKGAYAEGASGGGERRGGRRGGGRQGGGAGWRGGDGGKFRAPNRRGSGAHAGAPRQGAGQSE